MADRVGVMYAGRIVEEAPVRELFRNPRHPYTRGLLASIPGGAPGSRLQAIQGTVPPLGDLPPGCSFAPRCPNRFDPCDVAPPGVTVILRPGVDLPPDVGLPPKGGSYGVSKGSAGGVSGPGGASGPGGVSGAGSFRVQAEGHEAAPDAHAHTTRCYLYSPAVDPQVLPEVKR
jgi:oligopeptide/dipeptide ABC transporter ATP-binding protein